MRNYDPATGLDDGTYNYPEGLMVTSGILQFFYKTLSHRVSIELPIPSVPTQMHPMVGL